MPSLIRAKGLYTFQNELSAPDGALEVADNIVINEEGVIEPRRGFGDWGTVGSSYSKQLMIYKERILRHVGTTLQYDSDGSGTFSSFNGSYTECETGLRIKSIETKGNLYFTTSDGIKKIPAKTSSDFTTSSGFIESAGIAKALDFSLDLVNAGSGWMPNLKQVAYRHMWGKTDINGNLLYGSPSQRMIISNETGSTCDVRLTLNIPSEINSSYFLQVYRTDIVDLPAGDADGCGDEMRLCYETSYSSIVSSQITDDTLTAFRDTGDPLYTNESEDGIIQSNDPPPYAKDISLFKNYVFYSNTKTKQNYSLTLLSTDDLNNQNFAVGSSATDVRKYKFTKYAEAETPFDASSVDDGTDVINHAGAGLQTGQNFYLYTSGTMPGGLTAGTEYWAINASSTSFQVAASLADAIAPTPINITSVGSGTLTIVPGKEKYISTVTHASDNFTCTAHGFENGMGVTLTTTGTYPTVDAGFAAFAADATYYICNKTADTFQLSYSKGGAISVQPITFSSAGSGNFVVQSIDDPTKSTYYQELLPKDINATTNVITAYSHGLRTGYKVQFSVTGAGVLPAGISASTDYYIIRVDADSLKLATTRAYALAGTPVVDITDAGTAPFRMHQPFLLVGIDTSLNSTAQQIADTCRNLVAAVNSDVSSLIYTYYLSTSTDLPGELYFEAKSLSTAKLYFCCAKHLDTDVSISEEFNPTLFNATSQDIDTNIASASNSNYTSNEEKPNRVYYSKDSLPEAVPTLNWFDIGSQDTEIYRTVALRDSLIVFKKDGIYIVTGASAPFSTRLLDSSVFLLSPDSAVILNNRVYCLTNQGVCEVTDTGASVISLPIEDQIKEYTKTGMSFKYTTFGVSYENDRSYIIFLPEKTTDTYAKHSFRYNTFTNSWVRATLAGYCGIVNPLDQKMYLSGNFSYKLLQERKANDRTDYYDREYSITLGASAGSIFDDYLIVGSVSDLEIGDVLYQTQYVTMSYFNRLLRKLDLDPGLSSGLAGGGSGYLAALEIEPGDDLQVFCQALDTMLQADATIGTYTPITFSASWATLQTEVNGLITQLNSASVGTYFKNYSSSSGTTYFENIVTEISRLQRKVYVQAAMPFLYGSSNGLVICRGINSTVVWKPQHFGNIDSVKQVNEGTFLFDNNNFYGAKVAFKSDLSRSFEEISVSGNGTGVWGFESWGDFYWGGEGTDAPFRVYIPRDKQRCRYLTCKFNHFNSRNYFRLLGISLNGRVVNTRGYR